MTEAREPRRRHGPAALDAADPLAAFRDRFVVDDPALVYLDGNSLGRPPRATIDRLEQVVRAEWAGELVPRLGPLARRAAPGSASSSGPASSGPCPTRRWSATRPRSTSTSWRARHSTPAPTARRSSSRPTSSRPTATSSRAWRPPAAARSAGCAPMRSTGRPSADLEALLDATSRSSCCRSSTTARRPSPTWPDHRARARRRRARPLGPVAMPSARSRSSSRGRAPTLRSAARTSTSTAGPGRPPSCTSGAPARTSCGRRSRAGSASATSSRWARATTRRPGSGAGSPGRPGCSRWPPSRRASGSRPRPGSRRSGPRASP